MSGFGLTGNRFNRYVEQLEIALNVDIDDDGHIGYDKSPSTRIVSANGPKEPFFHASLVIPMPPPNALKGRTIRALFIGINYRNTKAELKGCANDVALIQNFLTLKCRFPVTEARILVEDADASLIPGGSDAVPTKKNILESLQWLVHGSKKGDVFFLHYSGHGTSVKDTSGDEDDGLDEAMVPLDYQENGLIIDDDIYKIIVGGMHKESKLTAVVDCCHSGTLLDLPYSHIAGEGHLAQQQQQEDGKKKDGVFGSLAKRFFRKGKHSKDDIPQLPDIMMFSGCKDNQTSADVADTSLMFETSETNARAAGNAGGACSNALVEIMLKQKTKITTANLIEKMQDNLQMRGFTQVPQLSSSRPLDASANFSFF